MARPTTATPARARTRPVIDPRLIVGLVLVLASVAGVVGIVRATDSTVAVYAAPHALLPGERIDATALVSRDVALDGADPHYLRVGDLPRSGLVVRRVVGSGELVPRSAVGSSADAELVSIVVTVDGPLPGAVRASAEVDLWAAPPDRAGSEGAEPGEPPSVVVPRAIVAQVVEAGRLVSDDSRSIELLVPRERVARVLQAQSAGARLAVVPTGTVLGEGT